MSLRPQIAYLIGCTTIAVKDLMRLFRPVLNVILHTLGLNRNFPLTGIHAGVGNLGLAFNDIVFVQGIAQLQLLLGI